MINYDDQFDIPIPTSVVCMYISNMIYENCDIAIAMSSSRADPVVGLYILSYWGYLDI